MQQAAPFFFLVVGVVLVALGCGTFGRLSKSPQPECRESAWAVLLLTALLGGFLVFAGAYLLQVRLG